MISAVMCLVAMSQRAGRGGGRKLDAKHRTGLRELFEENVEEYHELVTAAQQRNIELGHLAEDGTAAEEDGTAAED